MEVNIEKISAKFGEDLHRFLFSGSRNAVLVGDHFSVYVRKSRRALSKGGEVVECVDVANVMIEEGWRSLGLFTALLCVVEGMCRNVYVENILNERLAGFLVRRGYVVFMMNEYDVCAYRSVG